MADKVDFLVNDSQPSVHAVVTQLVEHTDQIEEIYVITKFKDGDWQPSMAGTQQGLAFAIMMLQDFWLHSEEDAE